MKARGPNPDNENGVSHGAFLNLFNIDVRIPNEAPEKGKEGKTMSQARTSCEAEPASTGIPDYRITDSKSLEEVTKGPRQIAGSCFFRIVDLLVNRRPLETGFLTLLTCTALYFQIDAGIWNGICQLLARLMIGTN
jgi:hypothetical protein